MTLLLDAVAHFLSEHYEACNLRTAEFKTSPWATSDADNHPVNCGLSRAFDCRGTEDMDRLGAMCNASHRQKAA